MSTIFTKIINGEIPAYKIAEDENFVAFLDAMPLVKGHTLVVPKKEVDLIFDMETEEYKGLWAFAQEVAKKSEKCSSLHKSRSGSSGIRSSAYSYSFNSFKQNGRYEFQKRKAET